MTTITATDAKKNFGDLMISIIKKPVFIEKHNKKYAVMLSYEEYEKLKEANYLEDQTLGKMATKAQKQGYISSKKSEDLMNKMLKG